MAFLKRADFLTRVGCESQNIGHRASSGFLFYWAMLSVLNRNGQALPPGSEICMTGLAVAQSPLEVSGASGWQR
jgi:hypothetical protein